LDQRSNIDKKDARDGSSQAAAKGSEVLVRPVFVNSIRKLAGLSPSPPKSSGDGERLIFV